MKYNPSWQTKWKWVIHDKNKDGMLCSECRSTANHCPKHAEAQVMRLVKNWAKATELLAKHEKGKWHLASVEAQALSELVEQHGDVMDKMLVASELEREQNRELIKKLI